MKEKKEFVSVEETYNIINNKLEKVISFESEYVGECKYAPSCTPAPCCTVGNDGNCYCDYCCIATDV